MQQIFSINNRPINIWRLFIFISFITIIGFMPQSGYAHQTPNTLVFLDASPSRVALELQMPLSELELAFGNNISQSPETLIGKFGPQLRAYLKAHIHAYTKKEHPWTIEITDLRMDKGKYAENNIDYWELVANVNIIPQSGQNTRKFKLYYDVIMHQVINHVALVSIRSDWETGTLNETTDQAMVIARNTTDNVIYPLEISLQKGNWFKGFKSMLTLGINHIKEGTDHLLFLLTLLLPATLLVVNKHWAEAATTRHSLLKIIKIVTAFTIGHSVTLIIGALGLIYFPVRPIEILIAVSILISAIHAIKPIFPGREIYIAGGFGLIHGMAFAQTLANLNLDMGRMALSIFGFNLGIELMQLFVIAITIPWLIMLSHTAYYKYIRLTGAVFAGIAAIGWIVERITMQPNFISELVTQSAAYAHWLVLVLSGLAIISKLFKNRSSFSHTRAW